MSSLYQMIPLCKSHPDFGIARSVRPSDYLLRMRSLLAKGVIGLLVLLLLAVTISFGTVLLQTYREYRHLQSREASLRSELVELRREQEQKEEYLRMMLENPDFMERVVRDKLGYVRPDETVFLFDQPRRP